MAGVPAPNPEPAAIAVADLQFRWPRRQEPVLDIPALKIQRGERVFVAGPSGSGKTTLLNLLAGTIVPQRGTIAVLGRAIETLPPPRRDRLRADSIGIIFQLFNLIPYLSVLENVLLPCWFSARRRQRLQRNGTAPQAEALRLLTCLDMAAPALLQQPVTNLSVGQQQRVAAARALIGAPEILIADEPTSSLDADLRAGFVRLLFQECDRAGTTVIFVSHDRTLAPLFDRTIYLTELNRVPCLS